MRLNKNAKEIDNEVKYTFLLWAIFLILPTIIVFELSI